MRLLPALFAGIAAGTYAQSYPAKPIRIIVPYTPGGGSDFVARLVGQKLTETWGQQVNVDNRPGAGGNIGAELGAKAPPDGYTLLLVGTAHATNPNLYPSLKYDPIKDFVPITLLTNGNVLLVVHPSMPAANVKEFVALAKTRRGGITYSSSGAGQPTHLGMEMLKARGGFDAVHVPHKGSAPSMVSLLSGEVDTSLAPVISALGHVRSKKLKALAVTGLTRSTLAPEVPTVAESAYPDFEVNSWFGLLAPAGTPMEIVTRLHAEIVRIFAIPEIRERMITNGTDPVGSAPKAFAAYIASETVKWAQVIKRAGVKVD